MQFGCSSFPAFQEGNFLFVVIHLFATAKFSQKQINMMSPASCENILSNHLKLIKFQENMMKTDQVRKYNTFTKMCFT